MSQDFLRVSDSDRSRAESAYRDLADELRRSADDPNATPEVRAAAQQQLQELTGYWQGLRGETNTRGKFDMQQFTVQSEERLRDLMTDRGGMIFDDAPIGVMARVGGTLLETIDWGGSRRGSLADGDALLRRFESDPAGFSRMWKDLSSEERQLAMFALQQASQDQAQLTSMMTNLQQSSHSATMAIARNLSA